MLFTSSVEREELSIHWLIVTIHTQNPCFGSVKSIVIIGPIATNSCFIDLSTVEVGGAPSTKWTFLSSASARRFRQSYRLWPFLPQWRHSPSNLAGLFLLVVLFFLTLIELAVSRCVAGTSGHEASLSFAFANGVNVHRCRTCTVVFRLHSSTILVQDSANFKKLRLVLAHHSIRPTCWARCQSYHVSDWLRSVRCQDCDLIAV